MGRVQSLRLLEIYITHLGATCRFDGNPYSVFIDIPGAKPLLRKNSGQNGTRIMFPGEFDSKKIRTLLHQLPMFDRLNTTFTSYKVRVLRSKLYIARARQPHMEKDMVKNERVVQTYRFNRLPYAFTSKQKSLGGKPPKPDTWLF